MAIFDVSISRTAVSWTSVQIEAASVDEARAKALDEAGDQEYREKDAEYLIDSVIPMSCGGA